MKLTDYVAQFLQKEGIKHVFGLTGGAVVHLFDSIDHTNGITTIFTHHEQSAALAAESYSRITNNIGAAIVTTGPGGTNAITGVLAAWLDSIPCVYISGQSRFAHTSRGKPMRQIGSQEFDIISTVSSMTKYAVMVDNPDRIKYILQKAIYLARSGRPGPVWIDIPLDFQWATITPGKLVGFSKESAKKIRPSEKLINKQVQKCYELLTASQKPLFLAGYGIRLAHAENELRELIKMGLPFVSTWNASDIIPTSNSLYAGRIGRNGQKGANLAIRNCDFLLSVGSHLCLTLTGLNYNDFAKKAKKVIVDIDPVEIKNLTVTVDLSIQCDAQVFLSKLMELIGKKKTINIGKWKKECSKYKKHNITPPSFRTQKKYVNPYVFIDILSDELNSKDVTVIDGGGTPGYIGFHAFKTKQGQRLILSSGLSAMGTAIPESIGACFANGRKRTICIIGDGSMQLNIQELETIIYHQLPIKIFLFNNGGYLAIRHTQDSFFESKYIGSSKNGGVSLPDFQKIARAYGIKTMSINTNNELLKNIRLALKEKRPILCEVMTPPNQKLIPSN